MKNIGGISDIAEDIRGGLLALGNGHVGKIRMVSRDPNIVFTELFGMLKFDTNFLALLRFDGNDLLQTIMVKTYALDGYKILTGGNSRESHAMVAVSGKFLIDYTGTGVVATVENDQDGIFFFHA